ncbi:hypothetical protein FEM03_06115 [Phragmitibacter flavus]|uniref:Peptidase M23 domain-containing protein n=1 Tax=Phragmitibacter flavus TaxID=2576071 RepID=A0A5R8KHI9_9BACT|nr:DUF5675 family protein [Phragmitibacter flavus]TLD71711.1 hypothetical protein FEM03_06115 [Phragmitibacter flavus]
MPTPTGIRNKNYLNVKNGRSPWLDANGRNSSTDTRGHAVFQDAVYGIRAGILQLKSYFFRHNRRTIAEILSRWAPSSDTIGSLPGAPPNSPAQYTAFVIARVGVGPNTRLEIFDPTTQAIGNVGQLRNLFSAMAAYEIGGGFKVPVSEFNATLELLEPGIRRNGTDDQSVNVSLDGITTSWVIKGSVGDPAKGAQNTEADVKTVQEMLLQISIILPNPACDPLGNDGKIASNEAKPSTVKAIKVFQSRFLTRPDGLIEPEGKTWREMLRIIETGPLTDSVEEPALAAPAHYFPFSTLPSANWTSAPRSFGARRASGSRAHAGCDLYFPAGTVIHAITDGVVIRGPYDFYARTYALEIDHGTFIARYGEIAANAEVRQGDRVRAGQAIAEVGHLVGITVPSDMLHLELYDKTASGPLSVGASVGARTAAGVPYLRRRDIIDPTPFLNQWKNNLPAARASTQPQAAGLHGPAAIAAQGFCIHLKRIRQEKRSGIAYARTIGEYTCYWNGVAIKNLRGQIVERGGPGDNTTAIGDNQDRRIAAGTYTLAIQDGTNYKTYGYTSGKDRPRPGLLLQKTEERTAILIHPGENYLSSIGCLNPTDGLKDANSKINFTDSRQRVIDIIEAMKAKLGTRFPKSGRISDAVILIEGEPK